MLVPAGPRVFKLFEAIWNCTAGIVSGTRDDFGSLLNGVPAEDAVAVGKVMIDANLAVVLGGRPRESIVGVGRRVQRQKWAYGCVHLHRATGESCTTIGIGHSIVGAIGIALRHGACAIRYASRQNRGRMYGNPLGFSQPLVHGPEEGLVLFDRASEGAAEVVPL